MKYNALEEATNQAAQELAKKANDFFIKALESKGFRFKNEADLNAFIFERVHAEHYVFKNEIIFYADSTPFMRHKYKNTTDIVITEGKGVVSADLGTFEIL